MINLAAVPELPKSNAYFGSNKPPKPTPLIEQLNEFLNSIEAPKFCIAPIVFIISSLFKRPLILQVNNYLFLMSS